MAAARVGPTTGSSPLDLPAGAIALDQYLPRGSVPVPGAWPQNSPDRPRPLGGVGAREALSRGLGRLGSLVGGLLQRPGACSAAERGRPVGEVVGLVFGVALGLCPSAGVGAALPMAAPIERQ